MRTATNDYVLCGQRIFGCLRPAPTRLSSDCSWDASQQADRDTTGRCAPTELHLLNRKRSHGNRPCRADRSAPRKAAPEARDIDRLATHPAQWRTGAASRAL